MSGQERRTLRGQRRHLRLPTPHDALAPADQRLQLAGQRRGCHPGAGGGATPCRAAVRPRPGRVPRGWGGVLRGRRHLEPAGGSPEPAGEGFEERMERRPGQRRPCGSAPLTALSAPRRIELTARRALVRCTTRTLPPTCALSSPGQQRQSDAEGRKEAEARSPENARLLSLRPVGIEVVSSGDAFLGMV